MVHRNTKQQSVILNAVNELKCHATAEQVYNLLHENHPNISKATVYRNLRKLASMNQVLNLEIPGEPERFDHFTDPHNHIKCKKCMRIFDVQMDEKILTLIQENLKNDSGFDISGENIIFQGICPDCNKN